MATLDGMDFTESYDDEIPENEEAEEEYWQEGEEDETLEASYLRAGRAQG